ncbi:MAG: hypothetical protein KAV87_50665 [Desulfobacteraceae bacterium]|nr:hypothetical protein [Desulfobacteraceae bacterium]
MSNLDYPISLLEEVGRKILTALQLSGVDQAQRVNQLDGVRRAIDVLNNERYKTIKQDFEAEKKKEKIINDKNIKL